MGSRASAIRARGVVTIGSTGRFLLGLRAAASVPRSIDFRRSCSSVMDRGSFRAGNDLRSFVPNRPRLSARLQTNRMASRSYSSFLKVDQWPFRSVYILRHRGGRLDTGRRKKNLYHEGEDYV